MAISAKSHTIEIRQLIKIKHISNAYGEHHAEANISNLKKIMSRMTSNKLKKSEAKKSNNKKEVTLNRNKSPFVECNGRIQQLKFKSWNKKETKKSPFIVYNIASET